MNKKIIVFEAGKNTIHIDSITNGDFIGMLVNKQKFTGVSLTGSQYTFVSMATGHSTTTSHDQRNLIKTILENNPDTKFYKFVCWSDLLTWYLED